MRRNLERSRTGGADSRMELAVPAPTTPDGRVYRYSPNEKALPRRFVMGDPIENFAISDAARRRMKLTPRSSQTVCPYSGVVADDQGFTDPDDVKAAFETFDHAASADITNAIHRMFRDLARRFRSPRHLRLEAGSPPATKPRPRFVRGDRRELVCDHCGRNYGVFAIALFCCDCGAPNLRLHFARETELIAHQVQLAEAQEQELAYRLMGNARENLLTAFEAAQRSIYLYGVAQLEPSALQPKSVKSDFQSLDRAQSRFSELGLNPFATLNTDELGTLRLNIQKGRILGYNLGTVGERFTDYATDARIGETVRLAGEEIVRFAAMAQRVVDTLDTWLGGGIPAPTLVNLSTGPGQGIA
jgi:hypothetical protein